MAELGFQLWVNSIFRPRPDNGAPDNSTTLQLLFYLTGWALVGGVISFCYLLPVCYIFRIVTGIPH